MNERSPLHMDTLVAHADHWGESDGSVAPPIVQSSTFRAASADEFVTTASTPHHNRYYSRHGNPTFTRAEQIVAALEGAPAALLTASGMGAISTAVLTLVSNGDHVVAQKTHYMGTTQLLSTVLPRFGVDVTLVNPGAAAEFAAAVRPATRLILVETPANPLMTITDLRAVVDIARERSITTLCDSTIATPINQRPIELGIDLVAHSATKFLGGHHDLLAGVVAGRVDLIEQIWHSQVALGPVPDPFAAWLLVRGLRTFPLRMERHNRTALRIAQFLQEHPAVTRVHYPGLPSHPQHEIARRQMSGGYGGLLSFELRDGFDATRRFMDELQLAARAVSFGGFESLITHPAGMWAGSLGEDEAIKAGIDPALVRLSVGLEHADDLIQDLDRALRR